MTMDTRYAQSPQDVKNYNTDQLRENFLIEKVFVPGEITLTYSHTDRIIAGGIMPTDKELVLKDGSRLGVDFFFQRREGGIINIGGPGKVDLDGEVFALNSKDGLYIAKGVKEAKFTADDKNNPPKFYFNSTPAHEVKAHKLITLADANKVELGTTEEANKRTINQYLHPAVVDTCQLSMGMTAFAPGSVWNTMPCHTHERRMEVYLYFDMAEKTKVMHFMGEPTQTKHLVMGNEQAVISPSWSIHCGCGTGQYTFIWSMCGENLTYTDMDFVDMDTLR